LEQHTILPSLQSILSDNNIHGIAPPFSLLDNPLRLPAMYRKDVSKFISNLEINGTQILKNRAFETPILSSRFYY